MKLAQDRLGELGATDVIDTSATESYDFRCMLDGQEVHVEVKGTTSAGMRVLLTRNEVTHAREWHPNLALVVVSGIKLAAVAGSPQASGGAVLVVHPWQLLDEALEPISYEYIVPVPHADTEGLAFDD